MTSLLRLKLLSATLFGSLAVAGSAVALSDGAAPHGRAWLVPSDAPVQGECPYLRAHPDLSDDSAAPGDDATPGASGCPYLHEHPMTDDASPDVNSAPDDDDGPYLQPRPAVFNEGLIA